MKKWLIVLIACAPWLAGCDFFVSADARVARADKAAAESNFGLAAVEYRNALQSRPDLTAARTGLVHTLLYAGNVQAASGELEPLLKQTPVSGAVADLAAQVFLARGDAKGLLAALDAKRFVLDPERERLRRSEALAALGKRDEALALLQAPAKPGDVEADLSLARAQLLASMGRVDAALQAARELTDKHPEFARGWLVRGSLESRGGLDGAIKSLEKARQSSKGQLTVIEHAGLLAALVETHLARSDLDAAKANAAELTKLAPNSVAAILAGAQVSLAANDAQSAVHALQPLVTAQPNLQPAKLLLAKALAASGSEQQADTMAEQIVASVPDSITARKLLAESKLRLHAPQAAVKVLAPVSAGASRDAQLGALLSAAILSTSASAEATTALATDQKRAPGDLPLRLQLARVYIAAKRPADAVALLNEDPAALRAPEGVSLSLLANGIAGGRTAALAHAQKLADLNAENVESLAVIAEYVGGQREVKQAEAVLQRATKLDAGNTRLLFAKAHLDAARGDYANASASLQKIVDGDARNVEAMLDLAKIARAQGNADEAVRWLERARSADRGGVESRLMLADIYFQKHAADQAMALAREASGLAPANGDVQNAVGEVLLRAGQLEPAKDYFIRATKINDRQPAYWLNVVRAELAAKNYSAARADVQQALELKPDDLAATHLAASVDVLAGDAAAARSRAEKYAASHGKDASGGILLGDVEMELKDYARATTAYQGALDKAPSSETVLRLYRARVAAQDPQASAVLERWLQGHESDSIVRMLYAQSLQTKGDLRRAGAEYERLLADKPDDVVATNNLAWIYFSLKNPRALALAKSAYGRFPASPSIADTYGWILLDSGDASEAVKILATASDKAPRQAEIQYHYAAALAKTGAAADAQRRLAALLKEHPEFPGREDAERMLARLTEGTRTES